MATAIEGLAWSLNTTLADAEHEIYENGLVGVEYEVNKYTERPLLIRITRPIATPREE